MIAVAQAHTSNDPAGARHRALGRVEFLATADQSPPRTAQRRRHRPAAAGPGAVHHSQRAPAHPRLLLDEERSTLLNLPNDTSALVRPPTLGPRWPKSATTAPRATAGPHPGAPAEPSGQPAWLVIALAVLAAVLALVAGVAVLVARRATRSQHAGQTA